MSSQEQGKPVDSEPPSLALGERGAGAGAVTGGAHGNAGTKPIQPRADVNVGRTDTSAPPSVVLSEGKCQEMSAPSTSLRAGAARPAQAPREESSSVGSLADRHAGAAGGVSDRVHGNARTKPIDLRGDVNVGRTTTSAPPVERESMEHCQEMSGVARPGCQASRQASREQPRADPLTPIQHRAVELLAAGMRIKAVARRLCVDERTVYRWKKQPAFVAAIRVGVQMPITADMLTQLRRMAKPKPRHKHVPGAYRFEGKTFATEEEYLAEIERVSPAMEHYNR